MVRKSKGFSWGAAGVSTALFTGVTMEDVLRRARPRRKARFVCMEGADRLVSPYFGKDLYFTFSFADTKLLVSQMASTEHL